MDSSMFPPFFAKQSGRGDIPETTEVHNAFGLCSSVVSDSSTLQT